MPELATRQQPGKKWYLLALLLIILGPLLGIYLITRLFNTPYPSVDFGIPGTTTIQIQKPGQYLLWLEDQQVKRTAEATYDLQNTHITFTDVQTQREITLTPQIGWSMPDLTSKDYSLGSIYFDKAGTYQVTATGPAPAPYAVHLRRASLMSSLKTLFTGVFLSILGLTAGILLAIIILVKRISARPPMEHQVDPALQQTTPSSHETTWAMVTHLAGFVGFLFPLGNIIAPLVIWGVKRHELPYLDTQGKEAINFQISITIYYLISAVLVLLLIGLFLLPLVIAFQIIAMIVGAIEAAHGKAFRYPLTIRFFR